MQPQGAPRRYYEHRKGKETLCENEILEAAAQMGHALDEVLLVLGGKAIPEPAWPVEVDFGDRGEARHRSALPSAIMSESGLDRSISAMTHGPLLVCVINVRAHGKLNLLQGREIVRARSLVAVDVHGAIALEVGDCVDGCIHRDLLSGPGCGQREDTVARSRSGNLPCG